MGGSNEPVIVTLQDYTDIKVGMAETSRKVDSLENKVDGLSTDLKDHMEDEEKERKKIYRALLAGGALLLLQLFGVTIDPMVIIKFFF